MINLLPPQYKTELRLEEKYRTAVILGIIFLIFLISLLFILLSIENYLKGQVDALRVLADLQEERLQNIGTPGLAEKMTLNNQRISKIDSFLKAQVDSIEILEKVFRILPSEIKLTAIVWQKQDSRMSLSGFSSRREVLVSFRENLEEEKMFSDITFSPESWLKATDIDFQVTFKINTGL